METIACIVFNRVKSGTPYDINLKVYSEKYLNKILKKLEEEEEYEKCFILSEYIKERFNHELNYKSPII